MTFLSNKINFFKFTRNVGEKSLFIFGISGFLFLSCKPESNPTKKNEEGTSSDLVRNSQASRNFSAKTSRASKMVLDESSAAEVGTDPEAVVERLSSLVSGAQRKAYLSNLSHEAASNESVPIEVGIAMIKSVDENGYPEDVFSIYGNMTRLLNRIGVSRSLELLSTLTSPFMKRQVASSLGHIYAEKNQIPNPTVFKNLDEASRISIYDSLGSKLAQSFQTASELSSLFRSADLSSTEQRTMLDSIASSLGIGIDPEEILREAANCRNQEESGFLFKVGIRTMVENAPLKASEYLASNKQKMSADHYKMGVSILVAHLRKFNDDRNADSWESELRN